MKRLVLILALTSTLALDVRGADKRWARNLGFQMAGHVVYVSYDVLSYPTWGKDVIIPYRVTQYLLQLGIVYTLADQCNVATALGWLLQWWCFGDDVLYYAAYDLLYNKTAWRDELMGDQITWAWWTPVGLFGYGGQKVQIKGGTLVTQAAIGGALGISFTIF